MDRYAQIYGDNVHAVFPHLKQNGDSYAALNDFAKSYVWDKPINRFHQWHIRSIWLYLAEISRHSDRALYEVPAANGRCPDLILQHKQYFYIVDVKVFGRSLTQQFAIKKSNWNILCRQTVEVARDFEQIFPVKKGFVKPYVLGFRRDLPWGEYEPEWMDLSEYLHKRY